MAARTPKPDAVLPEENTSDGWRPNPGDTVTGELMAAERIESEFGDYPMLTIRTDKGDMVNVHAFHAVLRKGLMKLRPAMGSQLSITYVGQAQTRKAGTDGKKRSYHNYKVTDPTKPVEPFTWGDETDLDF